MLYFDTSALVKLYVEESGSRAVAAAITRESVVATHEIAYLETHSAFARAAREGRLTDDALDRAREQFERDWPSYFVVHVSQTLLEHAVKLVDSFGLRAYDALHLAAADTLLKEGGQGVRFACFDRRLNRAAEVLGLGVLDG